MIPGFSVTSGKQDHLEPGRVVGGMSIIEDGLRLTLYQVRTLRDRTHRLPADFAGWFPPQEIAA